MNDPLSIALVHTSDRGGGAEHTVLSLHLALLALGHRSRLYVGRKYTDTPHVEEIQRVRVLPGLLRLTYWLERTFGWQYLYAPGFRRLHRTIDPDTDILHIHSLWGASGYADIGGLPRLTRRCPTIITLHEQWLMTGHCACPFDCPRWRTGCGNCPDLTLSPRIPRDGTRFNWNRKRNALKRSETRITTVSDWLRQQARLSPMLAGKHISVVHNGIDDSVFVPGSTQEARKHLELPEDRFVVLLTGQSIEGINQGIAQQAVQAINRCNSDRLMVLLVGKSAPRVAETVSVPNMVLPFQESREALARCYRAADVTVVSSEYETFGLIAAESQACGTAVIAFSAGGLPEVVKDGVGGLVVPTGDVETLTAALKRMLDNPDEAARMGRDGAAWARAQFSSVTIARTYVDLYREMAMERGTRKSERGNRGL